MKTDEIKASGGGGSGGNVERKTARREYRRQRIEMGKGKKTIASRTERRE